MARPVIYDTSYYERNKESVMARIRAWQISNPDKRKATLKRHYENNKSSLKIAQQKYRRDRPQKYLYSLAKRRAAKLGREFSIELADIIVPSECPLLNIPINSYSEHQDFRPSVDRIDSSKGYVKGNVQVISFKANRLKNNSCGDELLCLAINLLKFEGKIP